MDKQLTMSFLTDELAEVRTHKKEFLEQMDRLVPWGEWVKKIQPHYYKGERGNKPYDLELMLRIYVLQNLYDLADMAVMNEIIDSRAFSTFCGVDSSNQIPDGDTIGRFRNILIVHHLQEELFEDVRKRLKERGLLLMKGTIVDSTLVAAPSSTKNKRKERDPDAHQVKINLSRIVSCTVSDAPLRLELPEGLGKTPPMAQARGAQASYRSNFQDEVAQEHPEALVIEVSDERRALERALIHFSHFQKQEVMAVSDKIYRIRLSIDEDDRPEILRRVLAFGPFVRVIEPSWLVAEVRKRISEQMAMLGM